MAKKIYKYDPEKALYVLQREPVRVRAYRHTRKVLWGFIVASTLIFFYSSTYYTPKMQRIMRETDYLIEQYGLLDGAIEATHATLDELHHRDNRVYRSLFAADTIAIEGVYTDYSDQYYRFGEEFPYSDMVASSWRELDRAGRMLYRQSVSLDELQVMSKDKEKMSVAIPAIWPIPKSALKSGIGAYGRRLHPIYKRYIDHKGIDMSANTGTPIYATGNGTIEMTDIGRRRSGYGQQVLIDHGFGYQTRYAHLSKILVEEGQQVVRGEVIGEVGNTGGSTGPHLHYEVLYMKRNVDPINYFRRDMDEAELERIIEQAVTTTFERLENNE